MGCGCAGLINNDVVDVQGVYEQCKVGNLRAYFLSIATNCEEFANKRNWGNLRLKMGNQTMIYSSPLIMNGNPQISLNGFEDFVINSQYKGNGRILRFQLFEERMLGEQVFASGQLSVNQQIKKGDTFGPTEYDVIMSKNGDQCFTLKVGIQFKQSPHKVLTFKIMRTLVIFKIDPDVENRQLFVKITVGEQILRSTRKADVKEQIPCFKDENFQFRVPIGLISEGSIEVYKVRKGQIAYCGKVLFDLEVLLADQLQHEYSERILNQKKAFCGTVKFYTIADEDGLEPIVVPESAIKQQKQKGSGAQVQEKQEENSSEKDEKIQPNKSYLQHKKQSPKRFIQHYPPPIQNNQEDQLSLQPTSQKKIQEKQRLQIRRRLKQPLPPLKIAKTREQYLNQAPHSEEKD